MMGIIITLSVLAYVAMGFFTMFIWAKVDEDAAYASNDSFWFSMNMLLWPLILIVLILIGLFRPLKLLLHKLL